jgi:hypothetical protein
MKYDIYSSHSSSGLVGYNAVPNGSNRYFHLNSQYLSTGRHGLFDQMCSNFGHRNCSDGMTRPRDGYDHVHYLNRRPSAEQHCFIVSSLDVLTQKRAATDTRRKKRPSATLSQVTEEDKLHLHSQNEYKRCHNLN